MRPHLRKKKKKTPARRSNETTLTLPATTRTPFPQFLFGGAILLVVVGISFVRMVCVERPLF